MHFSKSQVKVYYHLVSHINFSILERHGLAQNPNLCESGPCDQQTKDKSNENNPVIYILASVSAFLMLLLVVLAAVNIIYIKKRKLKDNCRTYLGCETISPIHLHVTIFETSNIPNTSQERIIRELIYTMNLVPIFKRSLRLQIGLEHERDLLSV
ncbi:hypothetical protein AHAS_Ahas03G0131100 [Arachis hypogaea]